MNSIKIEPKIESDDRQLSPCQSDRFSRRLSKYRDHQSDCQTKNDCSFRDMCEQESLQVKKLQSQQPKDRKVKKAVRRNLKRSDTEKHQQLPSFKQTDSAEVHNDFKDLNYREMFNLMTNDSRMFCFNNPPPQFPTNCTTPSASYNVTQLDLYYNQPF